jgi:16S rRNA (adenine1518-N6/adenine1519-N6)-dimethyltransferase
MTIAALPALGDGLIASGIRAERRLGQHFLLDLNICGKIARLAGPMAGEVVIEVGPGPGGLTRALLEIGARVVAIEKDERFAPLLGELATASNGRLTVVRADALKVDERTLPGVSALTPVVANLPYNVGSALLLKWLTGRYRPATMTLMFQKEVAARIVARPGGADYGRLSVLTQFLYEASKLMDLPAKAFTPPPKVDSSVVGLRALSPRPPDHLVEALQEVTRAAFGQRRKMLRSSVRGLGGEALCLEAGVDPGVRAQNVAVEGYVGLARAWMRTRA